MQMAELHPWYFVATQGESDASLMQPVLRLAYSYVSTRHFRARQAELGAEDQLEAGGGEPDLELDPDHAVWDFLAACAPPMVRFYQPLLDYGCRNSDYLGAIRAWPPPFVWDFLTDFMSWPGNGGMRETDARVLLFHLTDGALEGF